MVARLNGVQKVVSSNLTAPTTFPEEFREISVSPSEPRSALPTGKSAILSASTVPWKTDQAVGLLAYAMSIHKAKGLTLDHAYVDIWAAREPGKAYVTRSE